jgi:perosamine synthetase
MEEEEMIQRVLQSGWISMGRMVQEFERKLSEYVGAKHVVMVNNGTSALIAAYLASGVQPGDKVLVPSYTFIATVNALLVIGARPILMDADRETFNVTPELVESLLRANSDARYVVVVDVAGMPCDLDGVSEVCSRHDAMLIEDAAEAVGAEYRGNRVGSGNHTAIFSFHAAKLLSSIEGGAVVTNNHELAEKVRLIRNHGEDPKRKYWHLTVGLNLRPLEFQAALALAQLPKIDRYVQNRNTIAKFYNESLNGFLEPQLVPEYVTLHPYMLYMSLANGKSARDKLTKYLPENGVDYRLPWPPAHIQQIGYDFNSICPVANELFSRMISLPMYNNMNADEAQRVVDVIKSCFVLS